VTKFGGYYGVSKFVRLLRGGHMFSGESGGVQRLRGLLPPLMLSDVIKMADN
jgi:hypothetical protein